MNEIIAKLVANGVPIRGILRITGLNAPVLYSRIDFIHRAFIAFEEKRLERLTRLRRSFSIGFDFQELLINWSTREDRRTTQITSIASADNLTGFVFGHTLAYDPRMESAWKHFQRLHAIRDFDLPIPVREAQRFDQRQFLLKAQEEAVAELGHGVITPELSRLEELIVKELPAGARDDFRAPSGGLIVDRTYCVLGHCLQLAELLPDTRLALYCDLDMSTISALLSTMSDRILRGKATLAVALVNKNTTIDERRRLTEKTAIELRDFCAANGFSEIDAEARRAFIMTMTTQVTQGNAPFPFFTIPIHTRYEPYKKVGVIHIPSTGNAAQDADRLAETLDRCSLHAVDSFFSFLRNRISYAKRPGSTTASPRAWYQTAAYNPENVQKILDIARIYYNFVEVRERSLGRFYPDETDRTRSTPAMRIGLAKGPVEIKKIIYRSW